MTWKEYVVSREAPASLEARFTADRECECGCSVLERLQLLWRRLSLQTEAHFVRKHCFSIWNNSFSALLKLR